MRSARLFNVQVAETLKHPEIVRSCKLAEIPLRQLVKEVRRERQRIWRSVQAEQAHLEDLEARLEVAETRSSRADHAIGRGRIISRVGLTGAVISGVLFLYLILPQWFASASLIGLPFGIQLRPEQYAGLLFMLSGLILVFILLYFLGTIAERTGMRLRHWLDLEGLRAQHSDAQQALGEALRTKGILPTLRNFLNDCERLRSRSTTLILEEAPGLGSSIDPIHEIQTDTVEHLRDLLEHLPQGSIGVAGPRGAGKTTLIRSFCSSVYEIRGRTPKLAVMVSAPVHYDTRDFVLHLFAALCARVLQPDGETQDGPLPEGELDSVDERRIPDAAVNWSGVLLLLTGLTMLTAYRAGWRVDARVVWSTGLIAAGSLLLMYGSKGIRWRLQGRLFGVDVGLGEVPLPIMPLSRLFDLKLLRREPSDEAMHALRRTAAHRLREIRFHLSYSSGWSGGLKLPLGADVKLTNQVTIAQHQRSLPDIILELRGFLRAVVGAEDIVVVGIDELDKIESDEEARQFLNDIKAVFGVERCYFLISVSEDAMASFERRGLPFRDVFDSSFDEIVSIDHLGYDDARRLLRRRVIGLPTPFEGLCYCLSGGLPRDLIRTARNLVHLAKAHKGQNSIDRSQPGMQLADVCRTLVQAELRGKTRATVAAMKRIQVEPEVSQVINWCMGLEADDLTAGALLERCRQLEQDPVINAADRPAGDPSVAWDTLLRLVRELTGFYYYCATLLEVFGTSMDEAHWQQTEQMQAHSGFLDRLAQSRQAFAINPYVAWGAVSELRNGARALGQLDRLDFPSRLLTRLSTVAAPPTSPDGAQPVTST